MEVPKDNLLGVLAAFFRWKRPILWSTALVALATAVTCFILPNYYKSTTIFYAASPDQFKPELVFGTGSKDMAFFGEDMDIDRLLSIGKSNELTNYMIAKFDLYKHYKIDSSKHLASFKVRERFHKLYQVGKNKFDGIELSVEDKDPKTAALMTKAARLKIDEIASNLIKQSQVTLIETYKRSLGDKDISITVIADSMRFLSDFYNIADPDEQGRLIAEMMTGAESNLAREKARLQEYETSKETPIDTLMNLRARIKGYEQQLKMMMGGGGSVDLNRFTKGKSRLKMYNDIHNEQSEQLGRDKERLANLLAIYNATISSVHVVEEAEEPIKKSRPTRSLIIAGATIAALFLSALFALVLDQYRYVDWGRLSRGEEQL